MANPTPGTIEYAYNRIYIVVDPTAPSGPPTYRVSNPDEIGGPGGGGGGTGSGLTDIGAIAPITSRKVNTANAEIAFDITLLPYI